MYCGGVGMTPARHDKLAAVRPVADDRRAVVGIDARQRRHVAGAIVQAIEQPAHRFLRFEHRVDGVIAGAPLQPKDRFVGQMEDAMKYYAGLDVSLHETTICVVDADGRIVAEGAVPSDPCSILTWLDRRSFAIERAGLEIGGISRWLHEGLREGGLNAICIDPRRLRALTKIMPVKTDRNDARSIAMAMRVGWYSEVHIKSKEAQVLRMLLTNRKTLLDKQIDIDNAMVACTPPSSIFRHRNARASALTMALSTRGRGAHSAPSGVTTSFRPPRFLNVSGMWTVIVSPSAETVARVTPRPSCCRPPPAPARRARSAAAGPRRRATARRPARPAAARSAPARPGRARSDGMGPAYVPSNRRRRDRFADIGPQAHLANRHAFHLLQN